MTSLGENSAQAATVVSVVSGEAATYVTAVIDLVINDGVIGVASSSENVAIEITASDASYELANVVVVLTVGSDIVEDSLAVTCVDYVDSAVLVLVMVIAEAVLYDDSGNEADESCVHRGGRRYRQHGLDDVCACFCARAKQ